MLQSVLDCAQVTANVRYIVDSGSDCVNSILRACRVSNADFINAHRACMHISQTYCQLVVAVSRIANLQCQAIVEYNGRSGNLAIAVRQRAQSYSTIRSYISYTILYNCLESLAQCLCVSSLEVVYVNRNRTVLCCFVALFYELVCLTIKFQNRTFLNSIRIKLECSCCFFFAIREINIDLLNIAALRNRVNCYRIPC